MFLSTNSSEVLEGDTIQLTCSVHSTIGALSFVWQWIEKEASGPIHEVASVDRDGTVQHSATYRERASYGEIRVEKMRADTLTLSVYNALPSDEGQYRCTATEWIQTGTEPDLNWEKIGEKTAAETIGVKTVGECLSPIVVNEAHKRSDRSDLFAHLSSEIQRTFCLAQQRREVHLVE